MYKVFTLDGYYALSTSCLKQIASVDIYFECMVVVLEVWSTWGRSCCLSRLAFVGRSATQINAWLMVLDNYIQQDQLTNACVIGGLGRLEVVVE